MTCGCPVDALWESLHSGGESAPQCLPLLHAGPAWLRDGAGTYLDRPFHTLLAKAGWRIHPGVPTSTRLVQLHLVQHSLKTFVDAFAICFFALLLFSTSTLVPVLKPLDSLPPRSVFFPSLVFPTSFPRLGSLSFPLHCVSSAQGTASNTLVLCSKRGRRDPDIVIYHSSIALS